MSDERAEWRGQGDAGGDGDQGDEAAETEQPDPVAEAESELRQQLVSKYAKLGLGDELARTFTAEELRVRGERRQEATRLTAERLGLPSPDEIAGKMAKTGLDRDPASAKVFLDLMAEQTRHRT